MPRRNVRIMTSGEILTLNLSGQSVMFLTAGLTLDEGFEGSRPGGGADGLWVMGYELWVMSYGRVMGYGLWVMGYGLWLIVYDGWSQKDTGRC